MGRILTFSQLWIYNCYISQEENMNESIIELLAEIRIYCNQIETTFGLLRSAIRSLEEVLDVD